MGGTDNILRLSLKQDLEKLNDIVSKLSEATQESNEICSWFFPTKNNEFVKSFIATQNILKSGTERLLLELIIDRLYVGLRLLFRETVSSSSEYIIRPKQITLGYCFEKFCKQISDLKVVEPAFEVVRGKQKNAGLMFHNKSSQTDIISLNKCDSCATAVMCMKNILKTFDYSSSSTVFSGKLYRPQIFDITQFGCMLQSTDVVTDNLKQLLVTISNQKDELQAMKTESNAKTKENLDMKRKIKQLEEEVKLYKQQYEKLSSNNLFLSDENEELKRSTVQKDLRIKSLENTIGNLSETVGKRNATINALAYEKQIGAKNVDTYISSYRVLQKAVAVLTKNIKCTQTRLDGVQNEFRATEINIDTVNNRLICVSKYNENLKLKVKNLTSNTRSNFNDIYQMISRKSDNMKKKILEFEAAAKKSDDLNFKIRGNPVEDISRHVKENEEKIRELQLENEKLERILSKCIRLKTLQ